MCMVGKGVQWGAMLGLKIGRRRVQALPEEQYRESI